MMRLSEAKEGDDKNDYTIHYSNGNQPGAGLPGQYVCQTGRHRGGQRYMRIPETTVEGKAMKKLLGIEKTIRDLKEENRDLKWKLDTMYLLTTR